MQSQIDNQLLDLLAELQERPIAYMRIYSKITKSPTTGLLLSQIAFWDKTMKHQEFYKTNDDFKSELEMSEYQLTKSKKQLQKLGLVKITRKGIPAKTYYKLNRKTLLTLIKSSSATVKEQDRRGSKNKTDEGDRTITYTNTYNNTKTRSLPKGNEDSIESILKKRKRRRSGTDKKHPPKQIRFRPDPATHKCINYWNSLPMQSHLKTNTKVYKKTHDAIQSILSGNFFDKYKTKIKYNPPYMWNSDGSNITLNNIYEVFDQIALLGNPDITDPTYAKKAKQQSLYSFLFNEATGKSKFWEIVCKNENDDLKHKKQIDKVLKLPIIKDARLSPFKKNQIAKFTDSVFEYWQKVKDGSNRNELRNEFLNVFYQRDLFYDDYIAFVDNQPWIKPSQTNIFSPKAKLFKDFLNGIIPWPDEFYPDDLISN